MFSPAKIDLQNDETHYTDSIQPMNVIALHSRITPESHQNHPTSPDMSPDMSPDTKPDVTPEKTITVIEFCKLHSITADQFLNLRRKATRKYAALDFKPYREGSRTYWVQQSAILTQMIDEGATTPKPKDESIDGEIVDTQELSDGSALVIRRKSFDIAMQPLEAPQTREFIETDVSKIQRISASLQADQDAMKQFEKLTRLAKIADEVVIENEQETLIRLLIKQGHSKESAIRIASGL